MGISGAENTGPVAPAAPLEVDFWATNKRKVNLHGGRVLHAKYGDKKGAGQSGSMLQFCKPQTSTGEAPPAEWDNRYEEELCRLWAGLESSLTKIEDPAWRRWCDYIREKFKTLPNKKTTKKTMGKYIIKLAKGYEHLIIDLLSGMHVCLTTDGWTCNILGGKTEWFAVTAHFYDPDWVLRAVALPMIHVAGRTTAVALLPVIKGAMAQKPSRAGRPGFTTTAIVSDQRPPMPTLCRMFMGQVAMPDGLKQWLCDWGMCASHRVESTVENALKMMVSLTMLIQGCCAVVGIFSQSRPMQIILRETCVFLKMTPLSVIQNVTTRWWSTYALLLRLLYLMPALKVMYAAGHFPKFDKADDAVAAKKVLTDAKTFNEILLICVILEPLMVFQRWVEGERYVTGALLPYYIMCIRDHLDQVIEHPERVVERVLAAEHGAGDDAEEQDLEELRRLEHNEPEPAPPEEVAAGEGGEQGADGGGVPERVADAAAEGLVQMAALIKEFAQNLKKDFGGRWGDRNEDKCLGLRGTDYMKGMMIQQVLGAGLHPGCHLGFGKIAGIDDASLGEVVRKEHNDSFWRHMHAHAKEVAWSHLDPSHVRNRNPGYQKAGGRGAAGGGGVQESGDGGGVAPGARGGVGGGRAAPPSGSAQVRGTNENILGVAGGRGRGAAGGRGQGGPAVGKDGQNLSFEQRAERMVKAEIAEFRLLPGAPEFGENAWDTIVAGEWWKVMEKRFPTLAVLAREFLPVTATEAPSERVFSVGGRLLKNGGHRSGRELLRSRTFLAGADAIDDMVRAVKARLA